MCGSGSDRLVEVELRDGIGIGDVEVGALVEVERGLGWCPGGGEWWRAGGDVEVLEDGAEGEGIGEKGDDAHLGTALGAEEREGFVDPGDELCPAGGGGGPRRCRVGHGRRGLRGRRAG